MAFNRATQAISVPYCRHEQATHNPIGIADVSFFIRIGKAR
jgi:hypothetical protein